MADVFISHVEEDQEIAIDLARTIEAAGISVWYYERDSKPGLTYLEQICEAIDDVHVMIVLVSRASMGSHQVAKEIEYAHDCGRTFLPALVDVFQVDLIKRRKDWHLIFGAATSIKLGGNRSADFSRIVGGLKELVPATAPVHRPKQTPRPSAKEFRVQNKNDATQPTDEKYAPGTGNSYGWILKIILFVAGLGATVVGGLFSLLGTFLHIVGEIHGQYMMLLTCYFSLICGLFLLKFVNKL